MLKKIIIGALSTLLVGAIGVSAYNNVAAPQTPQEPLALSSTFDQDALVGAAAPETSPTAPTELISLQDNSPTGQAYPRSMTQGDVPYAGSVNQNNALQGQGWQASETTTGQGNRGQRRAGQRSGGANGSGQNSETQNGFSEWLRFEGTVSDYSPPVFTLQTDDGQAIPIQLGNLNYLNTLGLDLQSGDHVAVAGYWDSGNALAAGQISLENSGKTFNFRDDFGRPLWSGGTGGNGANR